MIGRRIRHYRIVEKLGEGGMGEVFVAFDETLERPVALKAIRQSFRLDDAARHRFMREARALSSLDHPGVCRIFDYLQTAEGDFLVLELLEGRSLDVVIRERPSRAEALEIAEQLAAVLTVAHEAGVIHHDLKPRNVMVTPGGVVKVLDFGLSRRVIAPAEVSPGTTAGGASRVAEPAPQATSEGLMGTLPYMSPEQASGVAVTTATDMFAFGLILQELLTGEPGRPRDLEALELLERVASGKVDVSPRLSHETAALVAELTRAEPEARPRAAQVLERLRWIRGRRRRVLHRIVAVGILLAGSLAWLKYTIDLRRRERQAEELIEYLVGDLRKQLEPLGRLDILADLGRRALAYFDAVPSQQWTEEELTRRCQAFWQLGDVLSQQGDHSAAMEFFRPALEFASELVRRDPSNADWLYERGQLEYYVGAVPFDFEDYEGARPYFEKYLATSRQLLTLDPEKLEYRKELAYAITNLGALDVKEARWDEAEKDFSEVVDTYREIAEAHPESSDWKLELADALSWQGECLQRRDLALGIDCLSEQLAIREELHRIDAENGKWEYLRATCLHHFATALESAGRYGEAEGMRARSVALARELRARDPSNADWLRLLGVTLTAHGDLLRMLGRLDEAHTAADEAREVLAELRCRDPEHAEWRSRAAVADLLHARLLEADGRGEEALGVLDPWIEGANGEIEPALRAEMRLVRGTALASQGLDEDAREEWTASLAEVESIQGPMGLEHEDLRAVLLGHLGRDDEAARLIAELEATGRQPRAAQ